MAADFPRAYTVVRRGTLCTVTICGRDPLIELRAELESLRQIALAVRQAPKFITALDAQLTALRTQAADPANWTAYQIENAQEIRAILGDAIAAPNARAIAEIDRQFPDVRRGLNMDAMKQDATVFQQQLVSQVSDSTDDVDALLATLEQASQEIEGEPSPAEATDLQPDALSDDDAALAEALLAEVSEASNPAESPDDTELNELLASTETSELADLMAETDEAHLPTVPSEPAPAVDIPGITADVPNVDDDLPDAEVELPSAELDVPTASMDASAADIEASEPTLAEAAPENIEAVSERMAKSLTSAEQQLDAIASAFEMAAVELGNMKAEASQVAASIEEAAASQAQDTASFGPAPVVPTASPQASIPATITCPPTLTVSVAPSCSAPPATATSTNAQNLRSQVQQARNGLLSHLDELLILLERVDQTQTRADESLRRAQAFERAAAKAQQASQAMIEAENEAARTRAAFQQAESRVSKARQDWQEAQQEASVAANESRVFC